MNPSTATYASSYDRDYPRKWGSLVTLVIVTAIFAAIGTIASIAAPSFYLGLNRPSWAPPASLFGPVWTVLYLMMAIAAWIVVRVRGWRGATPVLALYGVQLAANALWTWLFFHFHIGGAAFAEIIVMWLLIVVTIVAFWRTHVVAGALLLPYLAWVSFAAALTYSVWQANPGVL